MKTQSAKYKLVPIAEFDARQGLTRWIVPGVGSRTSVRGSLAEADLWTDRDGNLLTRFSSNGYKLHFRVMIVPAIQITPAMQDGVESFLHRMLQTWVMDGVDDDLDCDDVVYGEPES